MTLQNIARALGGEVSGQVLAPGPHHRQADRSLAVRFSKRASISPDLSRAR